MHRLQPVHAFGRAAVPLLGRRRRRSPPCSRGPFSHLMFRSCGGGATPTTTPECRRPGGPATNRPFPSEAATPPKPAEGEASGTTVVDDARPSSRRRRRVVTHSSLSASTTKPRPPPVDYVRGWAWQQCLLERRVAARKKRRADTSSGANVEADHGEYDEHDVHDDDDVDRLLLLEHGHVYTLGRGADESHLTFLTDRDDDRRRLSRRERGPDAARLGYDSLLKRHVASRAGGLRNGGGTLVEDEIDCVSEFFDQRSSRAGGPVLAPNGSPVYRVERGGEVTYHGPGQLVGYPLLDLDGGSTSCSSEECDSTATLHESPYQQDLHWYLRSIEEVLIRTLARFRIEGVRDDINTGVWVNRRKIAAVGVSASRWITTHGFALNVAPDLGYFDRDIMVPCGIEGRGVTSLAEEIAGRRQGRHGGDTEGGEVAAPALRDVADVLVGEFEHVFGVKTVPGKSLS